jgi:septum formation protein
MTPDDPARREHLGDLPPLVLASRSPRRAELLRRLGLDFEIVPGEVDETYVDHEMPAAHAERLAREKAIAVAASRPGHLVLGSDTIVVLGSDVLGKPRDAAEAAAMLRRLSGREHEVFTGVALADGSRVHSAVERVAVRFRNLGDSEIDDYVATGEPLDKAGAYGIQDMGSALVESIQGDYFAVMGLPVVRTIDLLKRAGWAYGFGGLRRAGAPRSGG